MLRSPPSAEIPTICSVIISLCNFIIFRGIIKNKIFQAYCQTLTENGSFWGSMHFSKKIWYIPRHGVCSWNQKIIRYPVLDYFQQNVMTDSYLKTQEYSICSLFLGLFFDLFFLFFDCYCHAKFEKKLTNKKFVLTSVAWELQLVQISLNFQNSCCNLKIRGLGAKLCVAFLLFLFSQQLWRSKVKGSILFVEKKN